MSELKTLLREAKHNLRDLESLLQKARSMDQDENEQYVLNREELQKYFEEILKILESLPENLRVEDGFEEKGEIKHLHLRMEEVRHKVEECFGRVEAACETNLHELSEFIENLASPKPTQIEETRVSTKTPCLNDLLSQGKGHFENEEFEACLKLMNQALGLDPGNTAAADLQVEAKKKVEDRRLEEELVIHIENLKKEAMDQFDKEQYRDCLRTFKFLCELEPKNRTIRDYLELSRQKAQEMDDGERRSVEVASSVSAPETSLKESVLASKPSVHPVAPPVARAQDEELKTQSSPEKRLGDIEAAHPAVVVATQTKNQGYPVEQDLALLNPEEQPNTDEEEAKPAINPKIKNLLITSIAAVILLLSVMLGWRTPVKPPKKPEFSSFEIQSDPESARVFVDGDLKGQTRLRLDTLTEGNHQLRVEMEGYTPLTQTFTLTKGQPTSLSVRLEKLIPPPESGNDLQEAAKTLFDQGNFLEASRNCDALLQKDAQNSLALELKGKIRNYYLHQSKNAISKSRWEEARLALENMLRVSPGDSEATSQLKVVKTKLKKSPATVDTSETQMANKTQDLHQQISAAISAANYLPPNSGNAVDLIHHLSSIAPADPFAKEKLDQIYRELLAQVQRKMQAKDFDSAKVLAQQLQTHFPETSELKNLRDALKAEEAKLMETWSSLIQKAESAMTTGRYVTPPNENALGYANRLLAIDSQNQRALALKKDSLTKAVVQAKEFIQSEKFEEAREIYGALLQLSSSESRAALTATELKREIEKLEFAAYPVVHDHTLMGSCTGRLRVNAYVISFIPSGNSKDGFTAKLTEIEAEAPGDKLKIQVKNKTYRYEANLVKNKEENREKLEAIYQRVSELKAKAN